jgi:hypothetical protein
MLKKMSNHPFFNSFDIYIKQIIFIFECIECGYKDNADFNAAKNIRNRVLVTVLRELLLKQLDNGAFEPRKLKREKVKEVLLSFRRSLQNVGSECTESSVTIFDYV